MGKDKIRNSIPETRNFFQFKRAYSHQNCTLWNMVSWKSFDCYCQKQNKMGEPVFWSFGIKHKISGIEQVDRIVCGFTDSSLILHLIFCKYLHQGHVVFTNCNRLNVSLPRNSSILAILILHFMIWDDKASGKWLGYVLELLWLGLLSLWRIPQTVYHNFFLHLLPEQDNSNLSQWEVLKRAWLWRHPVLHLSVFRTLRNIFVLFT